MKDSKYGVIVNNEMIGFTEADSVIKLAGAYLKRVMREADCEWSKTGVKRYLDGWVEWSQETDEPCNEIEQIIDVAVSNIVYSNVFFINLVNKKQISSEEKINIFNEVYRLLHTWN